MGSQAASQRNTKCDSALSSGLPVQYFLFLPHTSAYGHILCFLPSPKVTRIGGLKLVAALSFSHILALLDLVAWFVGMCAHTGPGIYSHRVVHDARGSDASR